MGTLLICRSQAYKSSGTFGGTPGPGVTLPVQTVRGEKDIAEIPLIQVALVQAK